MIIPLERRNLMDNGASSYRRFLEGDSNGLVEIIRDYKDGLILYLNGIVQNLYVAGSLNEAIEIIGIKRCLFFYS